MCCSPEALRWSRKSDDRREGAEPPGGRLGTSTRETRPEAEEPEEEGLGGDVIACC